MSTHVTRLIIQADEKPTIHGLLREIESDERNLNQNVFLEKAHILAHELPRRIREVFYQFKRREDSCVLHVIGSPVLKQGAGPTPERHVELDPDYRLNDAQMLHGLYGSLLGEAIGFTSQRNGSVYNTIVPLQTHQGMTNSSAGSAHQFGFHVEDAFHPARADFLGLVCMRNDEAAPTTISCVDGIQLTLEELAVLFEKRFQIKHNPIHDASGVIQEEAQEILFGRPDRPYVRINAAALDVNEYSGVARSALEKLLQHFVANRLSITLRSTDCIYIDNYRCVHARDAFNANFGPGARWLSRVVFTNDLRKSIKLRSSIQARAIAA